MTNPPHPRFAALGQIDWDDTTSILRGCTPLFDALTGAPTLLATLVAAVADDGYVHRIFGRDDQFGEDTDPDQGPGVCQVNGVTGSCFGS